MSQDKSPNQANQPKASQTGPASQSNDVAPGPGEVKPSNPNVDKDRVMDEPVDALRQPQGKPASQADKDKGEAAAKPQAKASAPVQTKAVLTGQAGSSLPPPTPPIPPTPPPPASGTGKSSGGWPILSFGLVIAVVVLAAGFWWQQQRFETVAREVATRLQQSDRTATQASDRASEALKVASSQREVIDQLSRELSVSNNELRMLQQAWEAANEGLDQTLLLNDLRRLITMANQELTLFGNVSSAIAILASVQPMLKNQSAPALRSLHQAVLTDLSRLHAAPQVDVALLSARLDSLIQLSGQAPLLSPGGHITSLEPLSPKPAAGAQQSPSVQTPADPATQSPPEASTDSWWQTSKDTVTRWASDAGGVLAREFSEVMSIRKATDPQALLLSEEQAIQLRANVRAMLLSAQLALMTRQSDIWRSELTQVQSLLNTRFDTQALDTKAALTVLNELLAAPVAVPVPQISDTLSALATADRAIAIPIDTGAEQPQAQEPEGSDESNTPETPASEGSAPIQGT